MAEEEKQLDRIEDMLTQLIGIVGKTNASVSELRQGVSELRQGQSELRQGQSELQVVVSEIKQSVERLEAHQALTSQRLDIQRNDIAVEMLERGRQ